MIRLVVCDKYKLAQLQLCVVVWQQELDSMMRVQKQQTQTSSTTEVRLNRALEEIDKYKQQLQKTKVETKVSIYMYLLLGIYHMSIECFLV